MSGCAVFLIRSNDLGWNDLRMILQSMPNVTIVGEAITAQQAMEDVHLVKSDLLFCSAFIEGTSALSLLTRIRFDRHYAGRVVIFNRNSSLDDLLSYIDLQLDGYLLWGSLSSESLHGCIEALLTSDVMINSKAVAQAYIEIQHNPLHLLRELPVLTDREIAVLRRLAMGSTRERIAEAEHLSVRTVKRIIASLEEKLDAPDQFVLGVKAAQFGLVIRTS